MFYDLNVVWSPTDLHLPRTLAFLDELGYNVVALNHTITGKLPADLTCPIPDPLPYKDLPPKLRILRRATLTLTEPHQNARLTALAHNYDLLALRPVDERTLQLACASLDCDIVSLDLTQRLPYFFRFKMLNEAIRAGKRFEVGYAQGVLGDRDARRNLIANATALMRACRARGLVIGSEARSAVGCRGAWDVINLATIWGLGREKGFEAMSKECASVVARARLKRTSYRGVVDVVFGGEKPVDTEPERTKVDSPAGNAKMIGLAGQKRKADAVDMPNEAPGNGEGEQPLSKTQKKKRARQERLKSVKAAEQEAASLNQAKAGVSDKQTQNEEAPG